MRPLSVRLPLLGTCLLFAACGIQEADLASEGRVDASLQADAGGADAAAPVFVAPTTGATAWIPVAEFEGEWDPATGSLDLAMVPVTPTEGIDADGLRTVQQAAWCAPRVANDGVVGSNPPDTFELYTDPASIAEALAGDPVPSQCAVGTTALYQIDGVFCAAVRAKNFYSYGFSNVYTQLTTFGGDQTTRGAYTAGTGTSAVAPSGLPAPGDELGLWSYGDLTARGTAGDAETVVWTFRALDSTSFRFRGRVLGEVAEICGNAIDDDCDGVVNNGCREFGTGLACVDGSDCRSGNCDAGLCADECGPGLYGADCLDCPGGATNPCNGRGTCDDGLLGSGACTCTGNFGGADCSDCADNFVGGYRVLVVSDYLSADAAIGTTLTQAGYTVTTLSNRYNPTTDITAFPDNLSDYIAVFWSASGDGFGALHAAATFPPLEAYVQAGGRLFVTGYDTIASPTDPALIAFLGGTGSVDSGQTAAIVATANALTNGVVDIRGAAVSGLASDRDQLTGLTSGTVSVQNSSTQGSITLRTLGAGQIVYFSNGDSGNSNHSSWTTAGNIARSAVLNFAFNARGGTPTTCIACTCDRGTCDDGLLGSGACTCDPGFTGTDCDACLPGFYGPDCLTCSTCSGNGVCTDGIGGSGACVCNPGTHGTECGFTCADGTQNGGELAVDCGGPCSAPTSGPVGFSMRPSPGTALSMSDETMSSALPIGFDFNFFGATYNQIYVSSNGFATFLPGQPTGCCSGASIPGGSTPNGYVALFWEDLNPGIGGTVRYGTQGAAPNREFVIEYRNVPHFGGGNPVTGQIVLREGANEVQFHCESCPSDGGTHTQGIENQTGTVGLTATGRNAANFSLTNSAIGFRTDGCTTGAAGSACSSTATCPFDSTCVGGFCSCPVGFTGAGCSECESGRFGAACEICPGGIADPCGPNGTCDSGIGGSGNCTCDLGWGGALCNYRMPQYSVDFATASHGFDLTGWQWSSGQLTWAYPSNANGSATTQRMSCSGEAFDMQVVFDLTGATEACCDQVRLEYSTNGGTTWTTQATYQGAMPGLGTVVNLPGTAGLSDVRVRFRLTSDGSINNTVFLDNFTSTCVLAPAPPTAYTEDFADGDHGFNLTGWTVSSGALRHPSYGASLNQSAVAPQLRCAAVASDMSFAYDLTGSTEQNFDHVYLEYSTDGGTAWTTHAAFTGTMPGAGQFTTLPDTAGEADVRVRFRLTSDSGVSASGPVIDNIGASCPIAPAYIETFDTAPADWTLVSWSWASGRLQYPYGNNASFAAAAPQLDCGTSSSDVAVTFNLSGGTESCCDSVRLQSSLNGTTWTDRGTWQGAMPNTTTVVIPGTAGQASVRLRWLLTSDSSVTNTVYLDDVSATCPRRVIATDSFVYSQNFAASGHAWTLGGQWTRTSERLTNSYPASASTAETATSPRLNCSTNSNDMQVRATLSGATESCCDLVRAEASVNGGAYTQFGQWQGTMPGVQTMTVPGTVGSDNVRVRFRITSDSSVQNTVNIDDVEATCAEFAPVYTETFDAAPAQWQTGTWTTSGGSLTHAYTNNLNASAQAPVFDCGGRGVASLGYSFAGGNVESNFDFVVVEYSTNAGGAWSTAASHTGALPTAAQTVLLPGTNGLTDVRVRFRFATDVSATFTAPQLDTVTFTCPVSGVQPVAPSACASAGAFSTSFDVNDGCFVSSTVSGAASTWWWNQPSGRWQNPQSGNYANSVNHALTSPRLDCTGITTATFQYTLAGETESGYDFVRPEFRTNNSSSWLSAGANSSGVLSGLQSRSGSVSGSNNVEFRFRFTSDGSATRVGPQILDFTTNCRVF